MTYIRPKSPVTIQLNDDYRIVAGEYAWLFEKRYDHEKYGRFDFVFNCTTLIRTFKMVREYFIRRSDNKPLPELLEKIENLLLLSVKNQTRFINEILQVEQEV